MSSNNYTPETAYCVGKQPKTLAENFDAKRWHIEYMIPLVYGIPSVIAITAVLKVLWSKKGRKMFQGPFYTFLAWTLLIDLITWIILLYMNELVRVSFFDWAFSWIAEDGIISSWLYAIQIYFTVMALLNSVILNFNRFMGIVFFLNDTEFWRRWTKYVLGLYFLFPICFTWHIFLRLQPIRKCRIQNLDSTDAYHTFDALSPAYFVHMASTMGYIIFVCGGLNLLMLGTTLFVLLKQHREDQIKPLFQRRGIPEMKLFIIAILNLSNLMLEVIYFICIRTITNSNIRSGFFEAQSFMLDWYYLSPVWTSILLIPSLRQQAFRPLYKKFKIGQTTVISITANQSRGHTI